MSDTQIISLAEDCVEIALARADLAHRLADQLRLKGAFEAVVPGLRSVAIRFDPMTQTVSDVEAEIHKAVDQMSTETAPTTGLELTIPLRYGGATGPDFEEICARAGLSKDALITLHSSRVYPVEMVGFTPGFAYLAGLPAALQLPRRDTPRVRLPAGSVGIAGAYSGLYAMSGPGGWSIIGQTDAVLFDPDQSDPFRVTPGMSIRFVPV